MEFCKPAPRTVYLAPGNFGGKKLPKIEKKWLIGLVRLTQNLSDHSVNYSVSAERNVWESAR